MSEPDRVECAGDPGLCVGAGARLGILPGVMAVIVVGVGLATGLGNGHRAVAGEVAADSARVEFFESKVRPILVEHCYRCHSAGSKSIKGGLRLDDAAALRKGGDTGLAVTPGDPAASLLMKAVRYEDESLRMPPKAKLPAESIAVLEFWIKSGAVFAPAAAVKAKVPPGLDFESARSHWAYQPIREPAVPAVKHADWANAPLDRFVLAKLEQAGLEPAPRADRRTLIRRACFDLVGLPPSPAEVDAFVRDDAPDAFARLVDRLLASPHYGERWGRHWMDVARYADTKDGVLMYGDDRVRPFAYTYRDYVIRALNRDLGYDAFVHDQLAADSCAPANEPWRLAAMGFLTLGRMFDNNIPDQIDDKIDTVTRGFLGLTVACARCHDHKYDAIPTADYYSLYGVFASCEAPLEPPLVEPVRGPAAQAFEREIAPKRKELRDFLDSQYKLLRETARKRTPDYLVRASTMAPDPLETAVFFLSLAPEDLRPQIVARWRRYLAQRLKADDPVFGPWHDLAALPDPDFAAGASVVLARWAGKRPGTSAGTLNPLVAAALAASSIHTRADVARLYGDLLVKAAETPAGSANANALAHAAHEQVRAILLGRESPAYFPRSQTLLYMSRGEKDAFGGKTVELDRMATKNRFAPARAMVLVDSEDLHDPRIFVRGNSSAPGRHVPRQFLQVVAGPNRKPFPHGGGRRDLADAITNPANPLTARVIVNRVWMHHMGDPLVATPSDFGTRSTPPAQPELLDYLAARFMADGWSLKTLHRRIMLSSVYQQSSADRPACRKVDPENQLLWRAKRRRLDFEAMRDAMLAVAGRLDSRMLGRPIDAAGDPACGRRTVYGMVDRQSLPGVFRAFDFASPDQSAERRPSTTVPQQALFAMNAPFTLEQARALAASPAVASARDPRGKIQALYQAVLDRAASAGETAVAEQFLAASACAAGNGPRSHASGLEQLAQVLLMTNEFLFLD